MGGPLTTQAQQRILRVRCGSSIPTGWRFVQWLGKETEVLTGYWQDVILAEFVGDDDHHA